MPEPHSQDAPEAGAGPTRGAQTPQTRSAASRRWVVLSVSFALAFVSGVGASQDDGGEPGQVVASFEPIAIDELPLRWGRRCGPGRHRWGSSDGRASPRVDGARLPTRWTSPGARTSSWSRRAARKRASPLAASSRSAASRTRWSTSSPRRSAPSSTSAARVRATTTASARTPTESPRFPLFPRAPRRASISPGTAELCRPQGYARICSPRSPRSPGVVDTSFYDAVMALGEQTRSSPTTSPRSSPGTSTSPATCTRRRVPDPLRAPLPTGRRRRTRSTSVPVASSPRATKARPASTRPSTSRTSTARGSYFRPDGSAVEKRVPGRAARIQPHQLALLARAPPSDPQHHATASRHRLRAPRWHADLGGRRWDHDLQGHGRAVPETSYAIRHANGYISHYAHLSRFAEDLRVGDRVKQKQLIGYVGTPASRPARTSASGWSKDGHYVDPLTIRSPAGDPIDRATPGSASTPRASGLLAALDPVSPGGRPTRRSERPAPPRRAPGRPRVTPPAPPASEAIPAPFVRGSRPERAGGLRSRIARTPTGSRTPALAERLARARPRARRARARPRREPAPRARMRRGAAPPGRRRPSSRSTRRPPRAGAPHLRRGPLRRARRQAPALRASSTSARGRHRAIVTVKSRGEVTLVGPFQSGKTEGPCRSFPLAASSEFDAALESFVCSFIEDAATP